MLKKCTIVSLFLLFFAVAVSAKEKNFTFDFGRVGSVKIGMTEKQVQGILGKAESSEQYNCSNGEPAFWVTAKTYSKNSVSIMYVKKKGVLKVVGISSDSRSYKYQKIGVGNTKNDFKKTGFEEVECADSLYKEKKGSGSIFIYYSENGQITGFTVYAEGFFCLEC
uniref:Lipoprotein SmpA/OmlA domain-containing protein n=1 Tax=candidate division CPR3 bacterium TaxID=2268181 RepID=A0A7C4M2Y8_UNCC3